MTLFVQPRNVQGIIKGLMLLFLNINELITFSMCIVAEGYFVMFQVRMTILSCSCRSQIHTSVAPLVHLLAFIIIVIDII